MRELYELKEKVYDELKNYGKKELTASTLGTVKDLTKTAYYLCELIEEEEEGYSGRGSYENRGNYENRDSYENRARNGRRRNSYGRNSYERNNGYSNDGEIVEELRFMMEEAPDERTKQGMRRLIQQMESR